jgi:hypothetical protein
MPASHVRDRTCREPNRHVGRGWFEDRRLHRKEVSERLGFLAGRGFDDSEALPVFRDTHQNIAQEHRPSGGGA